MTEILAPNTLISTSGNAEDLNKKPITYADNRESVAHFLLPEPVVSNKNAIIWKKKIEYRAERTEYKASDDLVINISSNENLCLDSCYLQFNFVNNQGTAGGVSTTLTGPIGTNIFKNIEITANSQPVEQVNDVGMISRMKTEFSAPRSFVEGSLGMAGFMDAYSADQKKEFKVDFNIPKTPTVDASDAKSTTVFVPPIALNKNVSISVSEYSNRDEDTPDYKKYTTNGVETLVTIPLHVLSEFFSVRKVLPMKHIGVLKIKLTLQKGFIPWNASANTVSFSINNAKLVCTTMIFNQNIEAAIESTINSNRWMMPYRQWWSTNSMSVAQTSFNIEVMKSVTSLNGAVFIFRRTANIDAHNADSLGSSYEDDGKITKTNLRIGSEYYPSSDYITTVEEQYLNVRKFWLSENPFDCSLCTHAQFRQWKDQMYHLAYDLEKDRQSYSTGPALAGDGTHISLYVERTNTFTAPVTVTTFLNYNSIFVARGKGICHVIY